MTEETDPMIDLAAMRTGYRETPLRRAGLAGSWPEQMTLWLAEAEQGRVPEPNAMVLATAGADGRPSTRTVLLKGIEDGDLIFFTNYRSRKGRELAENPWCSVTFPWIGLGRQVTIRGRARRGADGEADEYFASRPYGSQIGAHASEQSSVIGGRAALESAAAAAAARWPQGGPVPRPDGWGGYRVSPVSVEFWQGRADRLHDRLRYERTADGGWIVERLAP